MKILKEVLRKNRAAILVYVTTFAANTAVFSLYHVLTEALLYASLLSLLPLAAVLAADCAAEKKRGDERARALSSIDCSRQALPEPKTLAEADYRQMIDALWGKLDALSRQSDAARQDMADYYTAWVHQIKTPIAVMRLKLSDDTPENHALSAELTRIEQYVDMVLQYVRIGSATNDLVIREYDLDALIRAAVRKLSTQFVEKRLRLRYEPVNATVITDEKWFVCILEHLLSNAVKYTPAGTVTIELRDGRLSVSDTGVGIAPEDLPRIFEKGYTGRNGRLGEKSSGLGLYLAKKAADLLSIPLTAESAVAVGSTFTLDLRRH